LFFIIGVVQSSFDLEIRELVNILREYDTRSMPKPPARVDMRNMYVSLSGLLYSFMFCCRVDRLVCPSILLKAYADQNYTKPN
jgi:hypothetical protein